MASKVAQVADGARIQVWDLPLRLFHWLLVAAVAIAFLSAEEDSLLSDWHILSGWVAAILIVVRLAWGLVGGEHARFVNFVRPAAIIPHVRELLRGRPEPTLGHNALGAVSVILLLVLIAATVWTGATLGNGADDEAHEVLAWGLLALVALHVLAVVLMSLLSRENLVRAMLDGTKPRARHPGASDARPATIWAIVVVLLVLVASVSAIRTYDPRAFNPRSVEEGEHRDAERHGDDAGTASDRD